MEYGEPVYKFSPRTVTMVEGQGTRKGKARLASQVEMSAVATSRCAHDRLHRENPTVRKRSMKINDEKRQTSAGTVLAIAVQRHSFYIRINDFNALVIS